MNTQELFDRNTLLSYIVRVLQEGKYTSGTAEQLGLDSVEGFARDLASMVEFGPPQHHAHDMIQEFADDLVCTQPATTWYDNPEKTKVIEFLRSQGCFDFGQDNHSYTFTCPNGVPGSFSFLSDGRIYETFDGERTIHRNLDAFTEAWMSNTEGV